MVPAFMPDPTTAWAILAVAFAFVGTFYKFAAETWGWGEGRLFRWATRETWLLLPAAVIGVPVWLGAGTGLAVLAGGCLIGAALIFALGRFTPVAWLTAPLALTGYLVYTTADRFDGALLVASAVGMIAR